MAFTFYPAVGDLRGCGEYGNWILQIDIPHIPYPDNIENFRSLCDLGSKLRSAHLLEFDATTNLIEYPIDGTNIIENIFFNDNKIFINEFQYFGNIEESVWNKKIGSYEPSQKWLKDRKGKELSFEDIQHFQKLITSLSVTIKVAFEIDKVQIL